MRINVRFWLDGETLELSGPAEEDAYDRLEYLPSVGDRIMPTRGPFVVTERWIGPDASAWNIVLRKAETPSESVPPWKRGT